jgi:hypothetical protein
MPTTSEGKTVKRRVQIPPDGCRGPTALANEAGAPRTGLTLRANWQPSPPEIARHPRAHPTLVLSANPKSLPPAGLHEPDVTLTFHIGLLRFEYA